MNVVVVLLACVAAAALTRAVQTKYFPKSVHNAQDYHEHVRMAAMYSAALVFVSAVASYALRAPRGPTVPELHAMMRERVADVQVPSVTKVF